MLDAVRRYAAAHGPPTRQSSRCTTCTLLTMRVGELLASLLVGLGVGWLYFSTTKSAVLPRFPQLPTANEDRRATDSECPLLDMGTIPIFMIHNEESRWKRLAMTKELGSCGQVFGVTAVDHSDFPQMAERLCFQSGNSSGEKIKLMEALVAETSAKELAKTLSHIDALEAASSAQVAIVVEEDLVFSNKSIKFEDFVSDLNDHNYMWQSVNLHRRPSEDSQSNTQAGVYHALFDPSAYLINAQGISAMLAGVRGGDDNHSCRRLIEHLKANKNASVFFNSLIETAARFAAVPAVFAKREELAGASASLST